MNKQREITTSANGQKSIRVCIRGRWVTLPIPQVNKLPKGVNIVGKA